MAGGDIPLAVCFCLTVFVLSIILFACSFSIVEPREYALVYDGTYMSVSRNDIRRENSADSGRYLIGLGRSVVQYPKGLVVMEWRHDGVDSSPMECWTSNGQNVYLDISLQLRLDRAKLPEYGRG